MKRDLLLKELALSIVAIFLLLSWQLIYSYTCFAVLLLAASVFIITHSLSGYLIERRKCFRECFFEQSSIVYKLLSGRLLIGFVAFVMAVLFSLFLFSAVVSWRVDMWVIIVIDVVILAFIYRLLAYFFAASLKEKMAKHILKSWSVQINTLLLTLFMLLYNYETLKTPDYIGSSLQETLQASSELYHSECSLIDSLVELSTTQEATLWYITLYIDSRLETHDAKWLLWLFFLLNGGIVYYGLSRLFIEFITFESSAKSELE